MTAGLFVLLFYFDSLGQSTPISQWPGLPVSPGSLSWTDAHPAFWWAASLQAIVWTCAPHVPCLCSSTLLVIPGHWNPDYVSAVLGILPNLHVPRWDVDSCCFCGFGFRKRATNITREPTTSQALLCLTDVYSITDSTSAWCMFFEAGLIFFIFSSMIRSADP